jgi:hypothetical protein
MLLSSKENEMTTEDKTKSKCCEGKCGCKDDNCKCEGGCDCDKKEKKEK